MLVPARSPVRRCPIHPVGCAVEVVAHGHQSLVVLRGLSVPPACAMMSHLYAVGCWCMEVDWEVPQLLCREALPRRLWGV